MLATKGPPIHWVGAGLIPARKESTLGGSQVSGCKAGFTKGLELEFRAIINYDRRYGIEAWGEWTQWNRTIRCT